jgi:hypothetical protein
MRPRPRAPHGPRPNRFQPCMRFSSSSVSRLPPGRRRCPQARQPGMAKAPPSSVPDLQAWTTSRRSPETNAITRMPWAETVACTGREIAPHTSVSTPLSARQPAMCAGGPSGRSASLSQAMRPASTSTRRTRRATSNTGAIRSFQTANAAFILQCPASGLPDLFGGRPGCTLLDSARIKEHQPCQDPGRLGVETEQVEKEGSSGSGGIGSGGRSRFYATSSS